MSFTKSDRYSAPHLTKIEGYPDRSSSVRPGMAYFLNSGPFGEVCGNCMHLRDESKDGKKGRCGMFKRMTGRRGEQIDKNYSACKFFEPKPKPKPIVARPKRSTPLARTVAERAEANGGQLRAIVDRLPPHLKDRLPKP